jgi:hypothetical protein
VVPHVDGLAHRATLRRRRPHDAVAARRALEAELPGQHRDTRLAQSTGNEAEDGGPLADLDLSVTRRDEDPLLRRLEKFPVTLCHRQENRRRGQRAPWGDDPILRAE